MSRLRSLPVVLAFCTFPSVAGADVQHVIGKGHTIEAIAHRYHVSAKAIIEANHLKDVRHLRIGEVLTIPKAEGATGTKAKSEGAKEGKKDGKKGDKLAKAGRAEQSKYDMKSKTPGVVHLKRVATTEEANVHVGDKSTKVSAATLKTFEKMMRSQSGLSHPIEPRLIALVNVVSNHFGSRKIEIVSGFRPYSPTQYTQHSNHNHGKAIDFRVVGVPNEIVRDFCRTLRNVGCGYYPNSTFVHLDVRDKQAFWIDYSKPGEPPRYNAPNLEADEGTSDVHDDKASSNATPEESPSDAPEAPSSAPPESDTTARDPTPEPLD